MPGRGQYWKVGGINDLHVKEADLTQALQDKINGGGALEDPDYLNAGLSGDQSSNLTAGNHVEFDTIGVNNSLTLSTGAGQLSGLIGNLKADTIYSIQGTLVIAGSTNTAELQYQWRDNTTSTLLGQKANAVMVTSNSNVSFSPTVNVVHKTSGAITEIELRITSNNSVTAIDADFAGLRVLEITR